jgi:hypothetical protein
MTPVEPAARLSAALADRYRLERALGAGGMATVYLARDLKHERDVAIKVLKPELGAVLGAERFLNEIRTTANLQHPHLLPLFDSGEADGLLYYVMPFVEGETLRARLVAEQQLPVDETIRLITILAGALDFAHARRIVLQDPGQHADRRRGRRRCGQRREERGSSVSSSSAESTRRPWRRTGAKCRRLPVTSTCAPAARAAAPISAS